jgi:hypothetical protein
MQSIKVDWCVVHDRQEWPVEVEDDDDRRRRPTSYGGTRRDRDDAGSGVAAPGLEHQHERNGENLSGGVARPDEEGVRCGAGTVRHIVAPRPEIYGAKTSAIRQAGLDYGYAEGYDFVLTVDDDCVLPLGWAEDHVKALGGVVPIGNNTVPGQVIRGFPSDYTLPVGISHGLWSGVLDYPAWFRREVLPAVFFQHTFRRHDDIFAGWIAQAALDLHGYGYVNGGAVVRHERASDAEANLRKEAPGDLVNTALLKHVRGFQTTYMDVAGTFDKLAAHVGRLRVGNAESDRLIQEYAASMLTWQRRRR